MSSAAGPSAEEQAFFDALAYTVLPSTAAALLVCAGRQQVRSVRISVEALPRLHVLATRRSDSELPWVLTRHRLHVEQGKRVLAFDIPHDLLNTATDLDAVVDGAPSLRCADGAFFFLNGASSCWIYKLHQAELTQVAELEGHVYAAAQQAGQVYAVGARSSRNGDEKVESPALWNVTTGRPFEHQGLDATLQGFAQSTIAGQFPPGYIVERLHADAFLGCRTEADGSLTLLAGVAEIGLPQDLDAGSSSGRGPIPGFTDYVGMAYFTLAGDEMKLLKVDFEHLFMGAVERNRSTDFYVVRNRRTRTPTLGCLHRLPGGTALRSCDLEKLHFDGVDEETSFNKFKVSHHPSGGYLALANVRWGFQSGVFSPEDYVFTSDDGLSWSFAGSSNAVQPIVPMSSA